MTRAARAEDPAPVAPADPYASGHGDTTFTVEHYDLDLAYRVRTNRLSGTATLRVRTLLATKELALDLVGLVVDRVVVEGAALAKHRHRDGRLVLRLTDRVPAGTPLTVRVRYAGTPQPVPSAWGPVGWEELTDGVLVASQPVGAPSWFPCNDRPDDRATYRTSISAENPYHVLAHGTLVRRRTGAGGTTWVYEERHPTASYLATVQIGPYSPVLLATDPVPQHALVPVPLLATARVVLADHGAMMTLFSRLFGPYPFEGYTLVVTADELEIPVEAQGLAVFGANHLAPGSDGPRLVPHELAHQWFGNAVSVASWQHLWLNEGFACYAEWLWSEESGGPTAQVLAVRHRAALASGAQDLVLADPGPERVFDDRVYKRGALTLHALRTLLGDVTFFALVRDWTARHRHTAVTTADFRAHARAHGERVGGPTTATAVDALLAAWLDVPALPALPSGPR